MRRLLIVLLVLLVPLKAWASVALPLAAGIEHAGALSVQHVGQTAQAHAGAAHGSADHAGCDSHDSEPHSHDCPHLTMPLLLVAPPVRATLPGSVHLPAAPARPMTSIVLDVLLPPPLSLA
jgi:hypothetical protein